MLAHQIGVVLCRVGAAVLTVQAIRSFGYALPGLLFGGNSFAIEGLAFGMMSIAPGLVAVGLWVYADRISGFVNQPEATEQQHPLTGVDLVRLGTALIGICLLLLGVIYATAVEAGNLARADIGVEYQSMLDQHNARMVGERASYLVQILIGIALLLGKERISALLVRAKYAGVDTS
jgi:hypothetical protein